MFLQLCPSKSPLENLPNTSKNISQNCAKHLSKSSNKLPETFQKLMRKQINLPQAQSFGVSMLSHLFLLFLWLILDVLVLFRMFPPKLGTQIKYAASWVYENYILNNYGG